MMRLEGKTALIAGAGRNSGKAIALAFAREGADLILLARQREDELKQVATECERLGVAALPLLADIADPNEVNRVVQRGLGQFAKIDVLICVAGIRPHKFVWEYDYDEWHRVFAVNVHATFYLAKAIAPGMIERKRGSIVALGSSASLTAPMQRGASEAASKHSLYGLIKSLALDLGPYGVRANLLALSFIDNDRRNPEWYAGFDNRSAAQFEKTPLRRTGKPEEVAAAALFLASDEASYITGDRIVCGGGRHM